MGGEGGGGEGFPTHDHSWKKNPTRSVNRKKNNVTQGKMLWWMHMSQEKFRDPQ